MTGPYLGSVKRSFSDLTSIKSEIDAVGFHDLSIGSIYVGLVDRLVVLRVYKFAEEAKDYEPIELTFEMASGLRIQDHDLLSCEEIYSYELFEVDGRFRIIITFLTGHSKPSVNMEFEFDSLSI